MEENAKKYSKHKKRKGEKAVVTHLPLVRDSKTSIMPTEGGKHRLGKDPMDVRKGRKKGDWLVERRKTPRMGRQHEGVLARGRDLGTFREPLV